MTLGERIRNAREKKELLQSELAKLIGVKSSAVISNWEKDLNKPDADKIVKLCSVLDVSASYLLDYYGNQNDFKVSREDIEFLKKYQSLDEFGVKHINYELEREMERVQSIEEKDRLINDLELNQQIHKVIAYPYLGKLASAGKSDYLLDDIITDTVEVPADYAEGRGIDFAIGVSGNSMEDRLYDGDIALIKKQSKVENGQLGVFIINNQCFIKLFENNVLKSFNPEYEDILLSEYSDTRCVGRVVGVLENNEEDSIIEFSQTDSKDEDHPIYRLAAQNGIEDTPEIRKFAEEFDKFIRKDKKKKHEDETNKKKNGRKGL